MKIIIYTIPAINVSLESLQTVNPADIQALKTSVANLSTGYANINSWITQHLIGHPTAETINSAISSALIPINSSISTLQSDVNTLKNSTNPIICAGTCAMDGTASAYGYLGLQFTYEHITQDRMTITHNYGSSKYGVILGPLTSYDEGTEISYASVSSPPVIIRDNFFVVESPAFIDYPSAVLSFIMFRKS